MAPAVVEERFNGFRPCTNVTKEEDPGFAAPGFRVSVIRCLCSHLSYQVAREAVFNPTPPSINNHFPLSTLIADAEQA
jgi:hypothetical protein